MTDTGYLEVKNFEQFQHYKQRNPPWIKLHSALLDDYEFARLSGVLKSQLICLWILASKTGNKIPADAAWIASRIGAAEPVDIEALVGTGFIKRLRRASDVQAPDKQVPIPSRVEESREETEKRAASPAGRVEEETGPATTAGQVLATVRRVLWTPDGQPPSEWSDGREMSVIKALLERGETPDDLLRAVHGLRLLQQKGEVDWLRPGKVTLRAVYNSKNGSRDMLTQALDAYAAIPPPETPRKAGQRMQDAKRADFINAAERFRRGA